MSIVNHVGILKYDTWRYYINLFDCSHFKGIGIEDNYYLFRNIYLNNGKLVNSRKKFWLAHSETPLNHGIDYIISDHQAAFSVANSYSIQNYLQKKTICSLKNIIGKTF